MSNGKSPDKKAVALIAGPTASGKSDLAIKVALALREAGASATIINADSAQVYRDLRILSARPSDEEMCGIEHRLFGTRDGADPCSAADWAADARREIGEAHGAGTIPIIVGGTGLYMRTLLDGIAPVPAIDPEVRERVRQLSVADAYAALLAEDPERAASLNAADTTRVARALEVVRSTGKPLSHWQARREGGIGNAVELFPAILLPDRERLYVRCDVRFSHMLEQGAIEEVRTLLERDMHPLSPVMRAIGVPEIAGYLQGEWTLDEAIARGRQATRNYAKRQYTWFKNQPPEQWPRVTNENSFSPTLFERLFRYFGLT